MAFSWDWKSGKSGIVPWIYRDKDTVRERIFERHTNPNNASNITGESRDSFATDYESKYQNSNVPIVIDQGSWECRAGWADESTPRLEFPTLVGKYKDESSSRIVVGNDVHFSELLHKYNAKSPFENNILYNFDLQENIFDYIFSHLGIGSSEDYTDESINHPIIMTEPVCNPSYSRKNMNEILFEVYGVPSICWGIDSLFSYYFNKYQDFVTNGSSAGNALIISSGNTSTHILPIYNHAWHAANTKRLNIGGSHCSAYMESLIQLKYPLIKNAIDKRVSQNIVNSNCYVATDYGEELDYFAHEIQQINDNLIQQIQAHSTPQSGNENIESKSIMEDITPMSISSDTIHSSLLSKSDSNATETELDTKLVRGPKIVTFPLLPATSPPNVKVVSIKPSSSQIFINSMPTILPNQEIVKSSKTKSSSKSASKSKKQKTSNGQQKSDQSPPNSTPANGSASATFTSAPVVPSASATSTSVTSPLSTNVSETSELANEQDESVLYPLLNIPDDNLTEEQKKEKRKQAFIRNTKLGRQKLQMQKQLQLQKKAEIDALEDSKFQQDPTQYIGDLKARQQSLLEVKSKRHKLNSMKVVASSSAFSTGSRSRSTVAKQKRMKMIAKAAFENEEDDNFGVEDNDWNVYLSMSGKEGDPESDQENMELARIDELLTKYQNKQATSVASASASASASTSSSVPEIKTVTVQKNSIMTTGLPLYGNEIPLGVERIRVPEIMFQPSICGLDHMGLSEILSHLLRQYPSNVQVLMAQEVFLTGGNSTFPHFNKRLSRDIQTMLPIGSKVQVNRARNAILDAWKGAAWLYQLQHLPQSQQFYLKYPLNFDFKTMTISKQDYEEKGHHYLQQHFASNVYIP